MGTLTSHPYAVDEGREYATYLERVVNDCRRLAREGRIPESEGLHAFLDDADVVAHQVKADVAGAVQRGERTVTTRVSLTNEEHHRLLAMSESIRNLLEIMEIRKTFELGRTESVGRVATAINTGAFTA